MADRPRILGIPTDPITFEEWLEKIDSWVQTSTELQQVCTVNPEFIVMAQSDPAFFQVLQESALNVLDGWGVVWALRLRGIHAPQRVTGSDGVPLIVKRAAEKGWKLFFLGAGEGIAPLAAEIFCQKYPQVQVVGTYSGSPAKKEAAKIIRQINQSGADILLVAYGAPQQDIWIYEHRAELKVKVAMGVGGVFDFVTGYIPRAPRWMRKWGLEWLYRLYLQPSRWRRMLRLPLFVWWVLRWGEQPINKMINGENPNQQR